MSDKRDIYIASGGRGQRSFALLVVNVLINNILPSPPPVSVIYK